MIHFEERPWGSFEKFHENRSCTVKLIHVNANCRLSLQYHKQRSEFWQVVKGQAIVELDGSTAILKEGESIEIPKLAKHRLGAGKEPCTILEIAYGKFEEQDIVRLEDDYSRAPKLKSVVSQFARTAAA